MSVAGLGAVAQGVISGGAKSVFNYAKSNPNEVNALVRGVKNVNTNVTSGMSIPGAVAKAAVSSALYATNPVAMYTAQASKMAVQGTIAAHKYRRGQAEKYLNEGYNSQRVGSGFQDTMQAQTMRQAALQQIQGNKLNARSALGGEARIFSNRRYTG